MEKERVALCKIVSELADLSCVAVAYMQEKELARNFDAALVQIEKRLRRIGRMVQYEKESYFGVRR